MWYLCGVGSNIQPEDNLPAAIIDLVRQHGTLRVSSVIRTCPEGIDTPNEFLNALVIFYSDLDPQALKQELNNLEERLGRDRSNPLSSHADRTIDVDILEASPTGSFMGDKIKESYYRELFFGRHRQATASLTLQGQALGQSPATVYRNQRSSHEVVVEQSEQLEHDTIKPTFPG
ncbi:2-amino-4-hydroxy-6-hydroxymethyldihydropteridine diphosphokinase [Halomonas kenyensis]|uniref:2-amino-4-hydroxy-6-hydroxymethyldihydropteridine pyrophosphokinase n=1 Tax=Billgrantia kenyensis TaxID=321266 RepID=A0A7V9W0E2_9GAMM|nr:2-amino-4-hydroxy-6-hydroxymethyldihydropteridine diphosphokinase [Halomonas kenyensis]MCG6661806.1 2-amino-4-hydroxy-6-hydroxymethyldihydropteridine diphosphokinase [Halomonas kenyensis]